MRHSGLAPGDVRVLRALERRALRQQRAYATVLLRIPPRRPCGGTASPPLISARAVMLTRASAGGKTFSALFSRTTTLLWRRQRRRISSSTHIPPYLSCQTLNLPACCARVDICNITAWCGARKTTRQRADDAYMVCRIAGAYAHET